MALFSSFPRLRLMRVSAGKRNETKTEEMTELLQWTPNKIKQFLENNGNTNANDSVGWPSFVQTIDDTPCLTQIRLSFARPRNASREIGFGNLRAWVRITRMCCGNSIGCKSAHVAISISFGWKHISFISASANFCFHGRNFCSMMSAQPMCQMCVFAVWRCRWQNVPVSKWTILGRSRRTKWRRQRNRCVSNSKWTNLSCVNNIVPTPAWYIAPNQRKHNYVDVAMSGGHDANCKIGSKTKWTNAPVPKQTQLCDVKSTKFVPHVCPNAMSAQLWPPIVHMNAIVQMSTRNRADVAWPETCCRNNGPIVKRTELRHCGQQFGAEIEITKIAFSHEKNNWCEPAAVGIHIWKKKTCVLPSLLFDVRALFFKQRMKWNEMRWNVNLGAWFGLGCDCFAPFNVIRSVACDICCFSRPRLMWWLWMLQRCHYTSISCFNVWSWWLATWLPTPTGAIMWGAIFNAFADGSR